MLERTCGLGTLAQSARATAYTATRSISSRRIRHRHPRGELLIWTNSNPNFEARSTSTRAWCTLWYAVRGRQLLSGESSLRPQVMTCVSFWSLHKSCRAQCGRLHPAEACVDWSKGILWRWKISAGSKFGTAGSSSPAAGLLRCSHSDGAGGKVERWSDADMINYESTWPSGRALASA